MTAALRTFVALSAALASASQLTACADDPAGDFAESWNRAYENARALGKADDLTCSGIVVPDRGGFGRRVALTFDDGPNPLTTPRILDILRAHNAPATFFENGTRLNNEDARDLAAEIAADPLFHLGSHTYSHQDLSALSYEDAIEEIDHNAEIFASLGLAVHYFRFPFGAATCDTARAVRDRDMTIVGWHIDSADWCFASGGGECPATTFKWVPDRFRADMNAFVEDQVQQYQGGVILFHDIHQNTVDHLDDILTMLEGEGYTFVAVDDADTFPLLNGQRPDPVGFIGDPCETDDDCEFAGGFCYSDGSSELGICTKSCLSSCPDHQYYPYTRCVAIPDQASQESLSLCTVECAYGCSDGQACSTFASPTGVERHVCWAPADL